MQDIRSWLTPPVFADDHKTHQAFMLHVILWALIFVPLPYLSYGLVVTPEMSTRIVTQTLVGEFINICLLVGLRRGYVQAMSTLQVMAFWLFFTVTAVTGSGLHGEAYTLGYSLVIVIAGVLLGRRGALITTLAALVSGGVMVYLEQYQGYTPTSPGTPFSTWVISLILFPVSAAVQNLATRTVQTALTRARRSETQYRLLIEESPSGIFIIDERPGIVLVNPMACQLLGYSSAELMDQDPRDLLAPDNRTQLLVLPDQLAAGEMTQQEQVFVRRDGHQITVMGGTRQMPDGRFQYIFSDITPRKVADAALQQRTQQLTHLNTIARAISTLQTLDGVFESIFGQIRAALSADAFMVCLYNPEKNELTYPFIFDDGQRRTQAPTHSSPGTLFNRVLTEGEPVLINRTAAEVAQKNALLQADRNFLGVPRASASLMASPMIAQSRIIGLLSAQSYTLDAFDATSLAFFSGVALQAAVAIENARLFEALQHELTQRQNLIQELEGQNAELERFTYTVSHDLKSPLITIGGFLGYLEQDALAGNQARMKSDILHIRGAANKMGRLLDELLELSRIGRLMNAPQQVSLADIVQEALALVHGRLQSAAIIVKVAPNLPIIYGDRVRLVEVLQNLLDNAAKFMGDQPQPCITIGLRPQEGETVFFVQDNGIGIAPQYHEKIFGLFDKLDPRMDGTGIGLALVKRIIEVHDGRIWVESAGLGQGSTFCFTLPLPQQTDSG